MQVDNSTLFLVQGTGQALNVPGMAWGNGFITDKQTVSALCTPRSRRNYLLHDCRSLQLAEKHGQGSSLHPSFAPVWWSWWILRVTVALF